MHLLLKLVIVFFQLGVFMKIKLDFFRLVRNCPEAGITVEHMLNDDAHPFHVLLSYIVAKYKTS